MHSVEGLKHCVLEQAVESEFGFKEPLEVPVQNLLGCPKFYRKSESGGRVLLPVDVHTTRVT